MLQTDRPFTFLIPAYNPNAELVKIVKKLLKLTSSVVIVVNDGSRNDYAPFFTQVEQAGATVLHHAVNLGKGAALKTGLNHAAIYHPNSVGVVTLDADGQHLPHDAVAVAKKLQESPNSLIMGCRTFKTGVPLRSRFGNIATRALMRIFGGIKVSDTQTGLRGIPSCYIPNLLRLRANGYEFEMDMLLQTHQNDIPITEIPITTLYIDGNKSSHFNPLFDSFKIYIVFLRYNLSSIMAFLIDYAVFITMFAYWPNILLCQLVARICSGSVMFYVNRNFVFKSDQSILRSLVLFFGTVIFMMVLVYGLINLLTATIGVPVVVAKAIAEISLYAVGFLLQREVIFTRSSKA